MLLSDCNIVLILVFIIARLIVYKSTDEVSGAFFARKNFFSVTFRTKTTDLKIHGDARPPTTI